MNQGAEYIQVLQKGFNILEQAYKLAQQDTTGAPDIKVAVKQAADYLGIKQPTLRKWVKDGKYGLSWAKGSTNEVNYSLLARVHVLLNESNTIEVTMKPVRMTGN